MWAEPFVALRVPKLFNLRTDPFERADITSNTYYDWFLDHAYLVVAAQAIVVPSSSQTFKEFPPRQKAASFTIDQAMEKIEDALQRGHEWTSLASWNDTRDPRGDRRLCRGWPRRRSRRRSVSPSSTTTARSGRRSRCRSSSASSSSGSQTMAEKDASLADKQPWKAAHEKDYAWLGGVIDKHYAGDDSDVKVLIGGILQAFAGQTVEEYVDAAAAFLDVAPHPSLGRRLRDTGYAPMVELLRYLEATRLHVLHRLGGSRDFMRSVTGEIYGIPSHRVIGSSNGLEYTDDEHGGALAYLAQPDVFDDGPVKPVRIWSRIGRRPIVAAGNSNGDVPMLRFAGGKGRPALRLLVLHDDADREFDYVRAPSSARPGGSDDWTVVSVKDDWASVFGE